MAKSPNYDTLCQSIEEALKDRRSGQTVVVRLPPDWEEEWSRDLLAWCTRLGSSIAMLPQTNQVMVTKN